MEFDLSPAATVVMLAVATGIVVGIILLNARLSGKPEFGKAAAMAGWRHTETIRSVGPVEISERFLPATGEDWDLVVHYRKTLKPGGPLARTIWTDRRKGAAFTGFALVAPNADGRLRPETVGHPLARSMILALAGETVSDPAPLRMFEISRPGLPTLAVITDDETGARKAIGTALLDRYASRAAERTREWPFLVLAGGGVQIRFDKVLTRAEELTGFADWAMSVRDALV